MFILFISSRIVLLDLEDERSLNDPLRGTSITDV